MTYRTYPNKTNNFIVYAPDHAYHMSNYIVFTIIGELLGWLVLEIDRFGKNVDVL